jgi:cholesterol 25-hydroxylase
VNINEYETLNHGVVDAALQVLVNVVVLNVLKLHPLTRALHNVIVVYLLVEAHSRLDLPFMMHRLCPKGWYGGAPLHTEHHRTGKGHYHQFFVWFDPSQGY